MLTLKSLYLLLRHMLFCCFSLIILGIFRTLFHLHYLQKYLTIAKISNIIKVSIKVISEP
nr:MAG TPA: hypothetical protein [Caudoviricetes sp.]